MSAVINRYALEASSHTQKLMDFADVAGDLVVPNVPYPYLMHTNDNQTTVSQKIEDTYRQQIAENLVNQFAAKSVTVSNIVFLDFKVTFNRISGYTAYDPPLVPIAVSSYRVTVHYFVQFDTDPSIGGQLDPVTIAFLTKLIEIIVAGVVAALIAYWTVQAIKDAITSMTTDTTTIYEYDPKTGQLVKVTTTKTPDYGGVVILVVGAIAVVGVIMVLLGYKGQRRQKSTSERGVRSRN